jgi:hypothetical protein
MLEQELTRLAMYDLVWSGPMTKVAEDLGISDVALKKICGKHRVPALAQVLGEAGRGQAARQIRNTCKS